MKKGFTLVELLAVIVILALLATVAVPAAFSISENIKEDMYCEKVNMLKSAAKTWGNEHSSQLKTNCYKKVKVSFLVNQGVVKRENETSPYILNPLTSESMDDREIYLYLKNKRATAFYDYSTESEERMKTACEDEIPADRPTVECS